MLTQLQRDTFDFFLKESNPENGLISDRSKKGSPASISVVGLGLSALLVGVERGYVAREEAIRRILNTLRFFRVSEQSHEPRATGYKGFYYHFLDMHSGRRAEGSELSTIDTTLLLAGMLSAAQYFIGQSAEERELRSLAKEIYERVDWRWACNGGSTVGHGWTPEKGFLSNRWNQGYSEALILYLLALGSPTFPIEKAGYDEWTSTFEWKKVYDIEYLYAGPLFIHQLSHLWVDFRGLHDEFNQKVGIDYFENSRRATYVHRKFATENPNNFEWYSEKCWGLTASDGPGPEICKVDGRELIFFDYIARGAPFGPDDGTVSPWAAVASLPFAPEIVLEAITHSLETLKMKNPVKYGLESSFNASYPNRENPARPWVSTSHFGLNQGPIVLMIENHLTGLIWSLMKECEPLKRGLKRAGFIRVS